jgi:hypothetical protein
VAEDIARVHKEGFEVDDDNEPLPENVPADGNVPTANEGLYKGQSWGWDGIDWQITTVGGNYNGPSFPNQWTPQGKSFLDLFLYFFQWPDSQPSCLQRLTRQCRRRGATRPLSLLVNCCVI